MKQITPIVVKKKRNQKIRKCKWDLLQGSSVSERFRKSDSNRFQNQLIKVLLRQGMEFKLHRKRLVKQIIHPITKDIIRNSEYKHFKCQNKNCKAVIFLMELKGYNNHKGSIVSTTFCEHTEQECLNALENNDKNISVDINIDDTVLSGNDDEIVTSSDLQRIDSIDVNYIQPDALCFDQNANNNTIDMFNLMKRTPITFKGKDIVPRVCFSDVYTAVTIPVYYKINKYMFSFLSLPGYTPNVYFDGRVGFFVKSFLKNDNLYIVVIAPLRPDLKRDKLVDVKVEWIPSPPCLNKRCFLYKVKGNIEYSEAVDSKVDDNKKDKFVFKKQNDYMDVDNEKKPSSNDRYGNEFIKDVRKNGKSYKKSNSIEKISVQKKKLYGICAKYYPKQGPIVDCFEMDIAMNAIRHNSEQLVLYLAENGFMKYEHQDVFGNTVLHWAYLVGNKKIISILHKKINERDFWRMNKFKMIPTQYTKESLLNRVKNQRNLNGWMNFGTIYEATEEKKVHSESFEEKGTKKFTVEGERTVSMQVNGFNKNLFSSDCIPPIIPKSFKNKILFKTKMLIITPQEDKSLSTLQFRNQHDTFKNIDVNGDSCLFGCVPLLCLGNKEKEVTFLKLKKKMNEEKVVHFLIKPAINEKEEDCFFEFDILIRISNEGFLQFCKNLKKFNDILKVKIVEEENSSVEKIDVEELVPSDIQTKSHDNLHENEEAKNVTDERRGIEDSESCSIL